MFRKSVEKIKISLRYDKNNGYFTSRPIYSIFTILSHLIFRTVRNVAVKSCTEN